jgi:membrane associated rhomboid family serine protease
VPDPRPRSPQQLLLVSALVALAGWVFALPLSRELLYLGLLGVAVALLSLLLRPQGRSRRYWRGRAVELPPATWQERVYRLLYRD